MTAKIIPFKEPEPKCSFCGRLKSQVKKMVSSGNAHICDACIKQATKRKDEA